MSFLTGEFECKLDNKGRMMVPSGLRSLLTIGPGPDDGGSKLNQRPHTPDKSGIDAMPFVPLFGGSAGGGKV